MNPRLWFAGCVWLCFAGCLPAFDYPRLSISNVADVFVISWPRTALDWALDEANALTPPIPWARVPATLYETNAEERLVRATAAQASRFYRLRWAARANEALTGLWTLDEGSGAVARDLAGAGESWSMTGTTWGPGRIGPGSLRFDGTTSRAWVSNASQRVLPAIGQPFSVSFWFNPDALAPGWRGLAGNDTGGTNGWRVALHTSGPGTNALHFAGAGAGSSLSVTGRTLLLPGQWHQLTVTHDGAEGRIYLDGALLAQGAGTVGAQEGLLYFGGGVGGHDSFLGRLDDVRTYTNCLNAELVSLAGDWKFDEGTGALAGDHGLLGHHGHLSDGTGWEAGRLGSGVVLGTGSVTLSNLDRTVLPPDGAPFSLSFWLRPRGLPEGASGLMHCGVPGTNGWQLALETGTTGTTLHWSATHHGGTLDLRAPVRLTNESWSRLDLTFNGGMATAYANGQPAGSAAGAIRSSRAPLVLGLVPGLPNAAGVLDELRIFRHERAASDIGPVAGTMWETVFVNGTTNIALRGSGPPGRPLTYALVPVVSPTNGTVDLAAGSGVLTYTAGSRKGPDAFAYTVSDGEFTSAPALVLMSVVEPHWLSPEGGPVGPQDGSSPERAWAAGTADALDALWRTNNYYDCFFYAPGEYPTRGYKYAARTTANPGCKHVGSGSTGPNRTTIKLVDALQAWTEDTLFGSQSHEICNGFEAHHLVLDCNTEQLPLYTRGEPVWVRVPLASTGLVTTVTLRWRDAVAPGQFYWRFGRAEEFTLTALRSGTNTWTTNVVAPPGAGLLDVLAVGAEADEILLRCDRRAAGVNYYGLAEMEIAGGTPSLPEASLPGGDPSRLDASRTALSLVDGDAGTVWASGAEAAVEIHLPLAAGTSLSQLSLHWTCQTLAGLGRLGPAEGFALRARDEATGMFEDVPFVRLPRTAGGQETCRFGSAESNRVVTTDRLILLLTNRAPQVDFYSLREVSVQHLGAPVPWRAPSAWNQYFGNGSFAAVRAVDGDPASGWGSSVQGTVSAINAAGSNQKFIDLRIVGFGTKAGMEGFPMRLVAPLQATGAVHVGNVLVEDCVFTEPGRHNADSVSVLVVVPKAPNTLTNAIVRRCTVTGLMPHFPLVNALNAVHLENSRVEDAHIAAYYEPYYGDQFGPVLLRSNRFSNVRQGVVVSSYPGVQSDSLVMLGNEIVLQGSGGYAFSVCDVCNAGPSGSISNVVALGNLVRYADWGPRPSNQDGGLSYTDMRHAVFANNIVTLGTAHTLRVRQCPAGTIPTYAYEDCEQIQPPGPTTTPPCVNTLLPGYRRAWLNNRDLSGALLPVRFYENGMDGLAVEQQWTD